MDAAGHIAAAEKHAITRGYDAAMTHALIAIAIALAGPVQIKSVWPMDPGGPD